MSIFVDTSALIAVLNAADPRHQQAVATWERLVAEATGGRELLVTTNYALVEAVAVAQRQMGMAAARAIIEDAVPLLRVQWIQPTEHEAGVAAFLAAGERRFSLVDAVSFVAMRELGIQQAFAYDDDFRRQGFETL